MWMQVTEVEGRCWSVGFGRNGRSAMAYVGSRDIHESWRGREVIEIPITEEEE